MGLLNEFRLRFRPPGLADPDFGRLLYMYIPRDPSRSYWEGEWLFPPTATKVAISLPGTLAGPRESAREFYLALPMRFDRVLDTARPALDRVLREWHGRPLSPDIWKDVKLGGFGLENPDVVPTAWDMGFETVGEKWLGITIPFVGDEPQEPLIDTLSSPRRSRQRQRSCQQAAAIVRHHARGSGHTPVVALLSGGAGNC